MTDDNTQRIALAAAWFAMQRAAYKTGCGECAHAVFGTASERPWIDGKDARIHVTCGIGVPLVDGAPRWWCKGKDEGNGAGVAKPTSVKGSGYIDKKEAHRP